MGGLGPPVESETEYAMIIRVYSRWVGGTDGPGERLSAEQRERLTAAIAAELGRVWDAAVAAGVPPEKLAEVVEERRRAIQSEVAGAGSGGDDVEDGGDDPVDDIRISH
jgi:hypothetical protein